MAITYNSLVAQITAYLDRTDPSTLNQIPNFISQAEERICRECKTIGLETYVTGNFTTGVNVLQKPGRWRENITLNFGTVNTAVIPPTTDKNYVNQLFLRSYEYIRNYWPDSTVLGLPLFYADYGYNNIIVAPTPDQAYPWEWSYLGRPLPLSILNQTNWLTDFSPGIILYGSLLEAIPYLKDNETIAVWQQYYKSALDSLNSQDSQRFLDRASNRTQD